MLGEESVVISGMLVGLNMIDCNFDLKGENIDCYVSILFEKLDKKPEFAPNIPYSYHFLIYILYSYEYRELYTF